MEEKVEELIDIYKQQIYSLCYKLAKTKEDAEDIFQETWIKVFSSRHQLSCVENYKKWITTICVRTFYDFYRKKKRWKDRVLDLFHKEDGGEIDFADEVDISEEFIQKVEAEMIREVIQLLNEKYKTVLVLYYYEQYSYKEMSEILNIPIGTVKYRLNYAKKQMRERLEVFVYDGR
ncbi:MULTISPECIES: RNA polymerase sigma factor [Bacillus]|uniref:RNA polymerase sigma-70 factor ECF subfamily n=2 Tax=Bacillus cereus group TaxID=86661 RepID=A0A164M803_BACCE|nr:MULTISPECIES: RNA polymerase sigma factor [Bacillus]KZD58218.1 RNA polymerase sigma-70 factor ECF subfamily [Bacillus cereus]NEK99366.1 RNA polymerase sigma factor [Bacillus mobilis]TSI22721.1 RNA polymerase sigma factor [Bacillus sp. HY001]SMD71457.1 ECF RNA polymerase sigma factor SigW [Bacillus mobilis]